ncbi:DNA methylase N-4/N-6 domain protein [Psychromonas ingrahamii 37]|uniref:site-specific DNA-methyltransferase (adenine-specific) n=1 Tax=Psychromonas ingrahamii (strain DSM 17664 / CCUG 51855 / 37) TaxID=357804 RepID=A1SXK0_PSYIN|nr:site-specific DNA-methyltransferase [Psychromonas ingrahamii]ABM04215.1 DNA methylase N-4/N-6 domain protein [Psychromonas ingrahamii 37]
MDKLKMHSPNLVDQNLEKMAELFPNCITEAKDELGQLKKSIDFDLLKQELSRHIVDGPQERYQLNWPGKREALLTANAPIAKTLRPCREESVNFDTTENLFIEGDNLDALKLLQETYLGKVKMIYIDPPYNTGNDFIYKDDFAENADSYAKKSNQQDEIGNRLVANTDSNGRYHSDWTSMIYSRLRLARNLLTEDGVIFMSIGQEEVAASCQILNEVLGENNFITIISRVMKTGGQKGVHFSPCVDYILVYAKKIEHLNQFREEISQNVIDKVYTKTCTEGLRKGEKYRSMGLYQAMLDKRANQRYYIECPDGSYVIPPGELMPNSPKDGNKVTPQDGDGVWRWTYERFARERAAGNVEFIASDRTSLIDNEGKQAKWNVYYRIWLKDRMRDGQLPGNITEKFQSRHSSAELKNIGIPFDFPKPTSLIRYLMTLVSLNDNDVILDFFAGSGTTAHASIEYAKDNNCNNKFVCVQLREETNKNSSEYKAGYEAISDITKERIRRAGQKILSDNAAKDGIEKLDVGFRVLKVDSSNMADVHYNPGAVSQAGLFDQVENVKENRTEEDLLFQVILDWGVDLTLPIRKETIDGKTVFFVDNNALVACFDNSGKVSESFVKQLAEFEPMRLVFRDGGFASDSAKINVEQVLKQLSPLTDMKSI